MILARSLRNQRLMRGDAESVVPTANVTLEATRCELCRLGSVMRYLPEGDPRHHSVIGYCQREPSTPPTLTTPTRGVIVADKSPSHHNAKKVGKSLKEKRLEKHQKRDTKKGLFGEPSAGSGAQV